MRAAVSFFIGFMALTPALATDWQIGSWIGNCDESHFCPDLKRDWPKAFKGDPSAQKNMTFYFSAQGKGVVKKDDEVACAWEIVLLASGHRDVTWMENSSLKHYCGRPLVSDLQRPRALADELFRKIYGRALPAPPWEIVMPVDAVRLPNSKADFARMAISAQILVEACPGARLDGPRVNALASRMGIRPDEIAPGGTLHGAMLDHGAKLKALRSLVSRDPAEDCADLTASYGRRGLSLQAIAVEPVGADYPN